MFINSQKHSLILINIHQSINEYSLIFSRYIYTYNTIGLPCHFRIWASSQAETPAGLGDASPWPFSVWSEFARALPRKKLDRAMAMIRKDYWLISASNKWWSIPLGKSRIALPIGRMIADTSLGQRWHQKAKPNMAPPAMLGYNR